MGRQRVTDGEPPGGTPLFTELSARRLGPVRRFFVRRPGVMDALVMLLFCGTGLLLGGGARSMYPIDDVFGPAAAERMEAWSVGLVAAGTVALAWRRRRPVTVAVAMGVLGVAALVTSGATNGYELGVPFALYAVAAARRALVTWWTFGGTVAALLAAGLTPLATQVGALTLGYTTTPAPGTGGVVVLVDATVGELWAYHAASVVLPALLAVAIGTSVRNRRLHVADLVDRANALTRDRDQQAQLARAAERARIAREMHDVVAHSLSAMVALGDGAASSVRSAPEVSRAALEELSATGRAALADMRRLLGVLHGDGATDGDVPFEPQPGATDLGALVERFRAAGLPVRATGLGEDVLPPDPSLQLAVVRIVEEALDNALRHAHGTLGVDLAVRRLPGGVEVDVVDQGTGMPAREREGARRGLIGMGERAAVYGGTVDAGPHGNGWRVHAWLPWDEGTR